jgi:outer membrane protein assembly factor BamB
MIKFVLTNNRYGSSLSIAVLSEVGARTSPRNTAEGNHLKLSVSTFRLCVGLIALTLFPLLEAQSSTSVVTRSYDNSRSGANLNEQVLTPSKVAGGLRKLFSLKITDDKRLEAQPLYVSGLMMSDGKTHDVVFVCTMANNVWAFDVNTGKTIWHNPINLGRPIKPNGAEIDLFRINILWGILGTPVIDLDTRTIYIVNWTSPDGSVKKAHHQLHALDISTGSHIHPPLDIVASSQGTSNPKFVSSLQKQRAALLLVKQGATRTLFIPFAMTHEEGGATHGWLLAYDVGQFRQTAAWCTTPNGLGSGIWQAGQGPSSDSNGDIYAMTGNYGVQDQNKNTKPPVAGDFAESIVKIHYSPPQSATTMGKLEPIAWFTPFHDNVRKRQGDDNFQDYDLGSGGPVVIPTANVVVGAGKDGVLYVLDRDTTKFGKGSDYFKLKQRPPIFFTYFPGPNIDAENIANLDHLFDGKTHHLHGSPVSWSHPARGPMLFVWGENECLRAWTIDNSGKVKFVAKSAEIASAGAPGRGGMPGGIVTISSDGNTPNTGIIWTLTPVSGDANQHVVEGVLRAYDASNLSLNQNNDGTPRLKLLWDSKRIPGNTFKHSKFCSPIVADGKVFVPTYDGRVDVYGL